MLKILSLFSNIGVAEALLDSKQFKVVIANELIKRRAELYSSIYPDTDMIIGDITKDKTKNTLIRKSQEHNVDVIMATPPCQGMSTAGKQNPNDVRNYLILDTLDIISEVLPKYVLIENVAAFLNTEIEVDNEILTINGIINKRLKDKYDIEQQLIDTADYGVPQTRVRTILLMTRKDINKKWLFPEKSQRKITLRDTIYELPELDPDVKDLNQQDKDKLFPNFELKRKKGLKVSKWHKPPQHVYRQVYSMIYTPTGKTAFDNISKFKPKKINGDYVKGYNNTYKRQEWDRPAYTVTMDNRKISSQNNVHPGEFIEVDSEGYAKYSNARTLSLYEIMKITTIPEDWNLPDNVSESFLRSVIGEGIPPLFVKKVFDMIGE